MFARSLLRLAPLAKTPLRQFCSNELIVKSSSRLAKTIQHEIKCEEEIYQYDTSVDESLEQNGFTLKETKNSMHMKLEKTNGGVQVQVLFQSRAPSSFDEQEEQQEDQPEENHENENQEDYCDFTVVLTRPHSSLVFECTSLDSEISVSNVVTVEAANLESYLALTKFERFNAQYNGPDFETLDPKLQNDMLDYLRAQGITEEVAAIVEHLSTDKEQRLYQNWLHNVHSFLQ